MGAKHMLFRPNVLKGDGLIRMAIPPMCRVLFSSPRAFKYYRLFTTSRSHAKPGAVPRTWGSLSCLHVSTHTLPVPQNNPSPEGYQMDSY